MAKQVIRETKETVQLTGTRPREAFQAAKRQCLQRLVNVPVSLVFMTFVKRYLFLKCKVYIYWSIGPG